MANKTPGVISSVQLCRLNGREGRCLPLSNGADKITGVARRRDGRRDALMVTFKIICNTQTKKAAQLTWFIQTQQDIEIHA